MDNDAGRAQLTCEGRRRIIRPRIQNALSVGPDRAVTADRFDRAAELRNVRIRRTRISHGWRHNGNLRREGEPADNQLKPESRSHAPRVGCNPPARDERWLGVAVVDREEALEVEIALDGCGGVQMIATGEREVGKSDGMGDAQVINKSHDRLRYHQFGPIGSNVKQHVDVAVTRWEGRHQEPVARPIQTRQMRPAAGHQDRIARPERDGFSRGRLPGKRSSPDPAHAHRRGERACEWGQDVLPFRPLRPFGRLLTAGVPVASTNPVDLVMLEPQPTLEGPLKASGDERGRWIRSRDVGRPDPVASLRPPHLELRGGKLVGRIGIGERAC